MFKSTGEVDASRQASANALRGLINIFQGLESRELANVPDGKEKLVAAASALLDAAKKMDSIEIPGNLNRSIEHTVADTPFVNSEADSAKLPHPKTLKDLYTLFARRTQMLGDLVADQAQNPIEKPVIYVLGPAIAAYLQLGDIVTRLGQTA